ncbi:N-acetyltransferase B complex non catalytic subunit-domain-containing protein [Protomyces lactucae-debilis]|uniref:N-acetyltransferase B complex non catalytic subunit-domain-containing protein n=1 Tax=Protomyces lactucae-debilis TaxID=2754530 RepID=A0A1Y2FNK8_PROLT|nr:N-acetyltransferase B complex non catalytic subunit-domain-containing protein [Protomyces lactucae-debilis]ORY85582.1 N-acetyltransferase B complex non catalytic subunit-domain-containing protein [Protomyces lactucae-debilis]
MDESLRLIWDAIDEGQFDQALDRIQKALRRSPNSKTLWGLKGLCQASLSDFTGAIDTCERIRKASPSTQDTYQTIQDILKNASSEPIIQLYLNQTMEAGFKACKTEALGRLWCMTAVRTGDFVMQRRAAVELQKGFLARQYFFLAVMSMFSLASRSQQPNEVRLLDMLMYRMMSKAAQNTIQDIEENPRIFNVEEFYLLLDVLERQEKHSEMLDMLDGRLGELFGQSQDFKQLKVDLLGKLKRTDEQLTYATSCISGGIDDWHFHRVLIASAERPVLVGQSRNDLLALVAWSASQCTDLVKALKTYMQAFGGTLTAYEDVLPFVQRLEEDAAPSFLDSLRAQKKDLNNPIKAVLLHVNICKLHFTLYLHASTDKVELLEFAQLCLRDYAASLSLGEKLEDTDNQYGDDLLLLACQILLDPFSRLDRSSVPLLQCAALLEYGHARSKHNYQFKLYLVRIYRLLGAWRLAEDVYKTMNVKQIQRDTLAFILYEDATFEHLATTQLTGLKLSQSPYSANRAETPEMICQAIEHGTYSKVEEFLKFQDRVEHSYWRYRSTTEIARLEMLLDKKSTVVIEKADQVFDNRSMDVVLNCLPAHVESVRPLPFSGPSNTEGVISDEDLAGLRDYQNRVQVMQTLTKPSKESRLEDNAGLLASLSQLSVDGKPKQPDLLASQLEAISMPPEDAMISRETLHALGTILEQFKLASMVLAGLKKSQRTALASTASLLRDKHAQLTVSLDSLRKQVSATKSLVAESVWLLRKRKVFMPWPM